MALTDRTLGRRQFLGAVAAGSAGALLSTGLGYAAPPTTAPSQPTPIQHLVWVWSFVADDDGSAERMRDDMVRNNLGVLYKTHDGTSWMGRYHKYGMTIHNADDVRGIANFFESAGVPFHAWCVVTGEDPIGEARMCAEVLQRGARSMTFDLEPKDGGNYWQAPFSNARVFGEEMRRLAPDAWLRVAPDPRPWQLRAVPMNEFASFCNEIMPQTYWKTFNSSANYRLLRDHGFDVGNAGVTPENVLDFSHRFLSQYGLTITPVGQGAANTDDWERFVRRAFELNMGAVSVWRYGTANHGVWPVLQQMQPAQPAPPPPADPIPAPEPPQPPPPTPEPTPSPPVVPQPPQPPAAAVQSATPAFRNPFDGGAVNRSSLPDLFKKSAPSLDSPLKWPGMIFK